MASKVLNTQTNIKGLSAPSQLTNEKLKIRMSTPIISIKRIYFKTNALIAIALITVDYI